MAGEAMATDLEEASAMEELEVAMALVLELALVVAMGEPASQYAHLEASKRSPSTRASSHP